MSGLSFQRRVRPCSWGAQATRTHSSGAWVRLPAHATKRLITSGPWFTPRKPDRLQFYALADVATLNMGSPTHDKICKSSDKLHRASSGHRAFVDEEI
jgi:hypothetical protein